MMSDTSRWSDKPPSEWTRRDIQEIAAREGLKVEPGDITAGPYGWCIDGMAAEDWFHHMLQR
jgi:hypothetical protein